MPLVEKVSQEDLMLYEIFRNPVLFAEFVMNYDKTEYDEKFELTDYQEGMLCDFNSNVSYCCARAVGKTVTLSAIIMWALVFNLFPEDYIVYTVPNKVHLEPVFTNLIRMFRANNLLRNFIRPNGGINSGDFTIELLNKAKLICRIAGQSGTGGNVIGLHTPLVLLDEAGYYPWGTWIDAQPIINSWTRGYRVMVSGVPTGLRENNVLYHVDQENSMYTKHRVTAFQNPRFSLKDEQDAIEKYGGKDSDDYLHLVLGKHGHPTYALFDRNNFEIEAYDVTRLQLNGLEMKNDIGGYVTRLSILPNLGPKTQCIMGIDLGYTESTAILVLELDREGRLRFHVRVQLDKVSYPVQEKIIDFLDSKYRPMYLGVDKGNAGLGVVQNLQESDEYSKKRYKDRLVPVDFSSWTVMGKDDEGNEIKQRTKPLATTILQDYCNQHRIVFSSTDLEMISELERMTYTKTVTGEIVYRTLTIKGGKKGEDHFTSALLCATLAHYMNTDFSFRRSARPRLLGFSWLGV